MDIKELRIGNWVKCKTTDGEIFGKICDILDLGYFAAKCNGVEYRGRFGNIGVDIKCIEPIELTDELLEKIGFKKKIDGYLHYREYDDELSIRFSENYAYIEYANLCFNPEDVTETTNYGSSLEFPNTLHLHTLQNIWHLLTGKELEIDL